MAFLTSFQTLSKLAERIKIQLFLDFRSFLLLEKSGFLEDKDVNILNTKSHLESYNICLFDIKSPYSNNSL
ncbi:hypothetical protein RCL_jg23924.t1 [Rhizophagus clarus]|uniref:Uncharacterized protein n=1 Tax=Rhizophagus clarus TaxID=94130 RepID=A0A8H3QSE4_9GLOM|nr:hypothetical protein RCL_jg23924.t1 [Rhizophagus clarus]